MISAVSNGSSFNAAITNNAANQLSNQLKAPDLPAPSVQTVDVTVYHGEKVLGDISKNSKSKVINELDNYSRKVNSQVEFDYDDATHQMIAKSRDKNGNVTRQYPTEGLIKLRARSREFIGRLLTEAV